MGPRSEPAPGSGGQRGGGHRRRRSARRQALDILFEADLIGRSPRAVLEEWRTAGRSVSEYASELVGGVEDRLSELDAVLGKSSEGWTVHRMPVVDRTILRLACYELKSGVPPAVAISEAVHAANELSTQDSGRFVNGVLGMIARNLHAEDAPAPDPLGRPAGSG
jgi:N utilization substance protein B